MSAEPDNLLTIEQIADPEVRARRRLAFSEAEKRKQRPRRIRRPKAQK